MKQLTVRNVSPELGRRLKALCRTRGESLNATLLSLLSKGVGLDERREWLERFMTATAPEVEELNRAIAAQRQVDEELWK